MLLTYRPRPEPDWIYFHAAGEFSSEDFSEMARLSFNDMGNDTHQPTWARCKVVHRRKRPSRLSGIPSMFIQLTVQVLIPDWARHLVWKTWAGGPGGLAQPFL